MKIFEKLESEVQSYGRKFPRLFDRAKDEFMYDCDGNQYLDFLAGAGTLNYGHNNNLFQSKLLEYIQHDGITHSLDLYSVSKQQFLETFNEAILQPRGYHYVLQFTGPTGTNAVEAAIKVARNVTGRENIIAFTNGFHGVTLGALAATGNSHHRQAAGVSLNGVSRMPYDGYLGDEIDTTFYLDKVLGDSSSGVDLPAAVIVETVQGEGGIHAASAEWLQNLATVCKRHDVLLIVDDIQAGCGRAGSFFSFEFAGIEPDLVTMSKSLSGYGLPMSMLMIRPELDQWKPGEHNGTFRGHNLAFVTATAAINHYWRDDAFEKEIARKGKIVEHLLSKIVEKYGDGNLTSRGRGLFRGLNCVSGEFAGKIVSEAFEQNLIIETSGANDQVVKCLCPLTVRDENLEKGLEIIEKSVARVLAKGSLVPDETNYFDDVVVNGDTVHAEA